MNKGQPAQLFLVLVALRVTRGEESEQKALAVRVVAFTSENAQLAAMQWAEVAPFPNWGADVHRFAFHAETLCAISQMDCITAEVIDRSDFVPAPRAS